jgi:hypothetical protein
MRTAAQCATMADEMDRRAAKCTQMQTRFDYSQMAGTWRWLAAHAEWQDRFETKVAAEPRTF